MSAKPAEDLSSNLEDYLEAIYRLEKTSRVARAKDIADRLEVSRASVSGALKALADKGLINYEPYSYVTLTKQGQDIARGIDRRHRILRDFLQRILQMEPQAADDNACRMEHGMDAQALERLVRFLEFLRECPRVGEDWLAAFNQYCQGGLDPKRCKPCLKNAGQGQPAPLD
ncbi:MAG: metal-dependent transcriptional regulator [Desulfarculus sp.]|jgi:DtxR family Mn-dependent transcriptional regulator|nr:MAG: metal-dependent transcriptional regulator [Desulfarculus sp.]